MTKNTTTQTKSQAEVWKAFEQNPLTHSGAHYLMTIHELLEEQGYARLTDIAERMDITPGSCFNALRVLKRKGYIHEDERKFLRLSPTGMQLVQQVERNDYLLGFFFCNILGVSPRQAEIDACKIEHLLSEETSHRLANFMNMVESTPTFAEHIEQFKKNTEPICHHDTTQCRVCSARCLMEV